MMLNDGCARISSWIYGHTELGADAKKLGWTVQPNANARYIIEVRQRNKEVAKDVNRCIKAGDVKGAIKLMQEVAGSNARIRELSYNHEKIIFDSNGVEIYFWFNNTGRFEKVEH